MQANAASKWQYLQGISSRQKCNPPKNVTTFQSYDLLFVIICICLLTQLSIRIVTFILTTTWIWTSTISWKGQCIFVHWRLSYLILFSRPFHLLSLQMQQPSPVHPSTSDLYLPTTIFCQMSPKRAWYCKYIFCYREQWISLPLLSPLGVQRMCARERQCRKDHSAKRWVWEWVELICIRARLLVRKEGREGGDRDVRNCVTSTTATAQEKGAKEIYICLPINLNLDLGRSQRTVIYELSKPEKFLLTLYFQLLHAFLQHDSVIL